MTRPRGRNLTKQEIAHLYKLFMDGERPCQIREKTSLALPTIYNYLGRFRSGEKPEKMESALRGIPVSYESYVGPVQHIPWAPPQMIAGVTLGMLMSGRARPRKREVEHEND